MTRVAQGAKFRELTNALRYTHKPRERWSLKNWNAQWDFLACLLDCMPDFLVCAFSADLATSRPKSSSRCSGGLPKSVSKFVPILKKYGLML